MAEPVAAIVPALDEAAAIGGVVHGLFAAGACCVIVVDGGSRDATVAMATAAGARIIVERARGYGRACLRGARAADADHPHAALAFLDGDGSCDPADLAALAAALPRADLVLGRRVAAGIEAGAMPWHARLGNAAVARLLAWRTGRIPHDLPPMKLVRRDLYERLQLDHAGYGWTVQLIARALASPGARIVERPVAFRRRVGGISKVSGSLRASARAGVAMVIGAIRETRPRSALAIVAKAPEPGRVKTRLGAVIGDGPAAALWAAFLADVSATVDVAATAHRAHRMLVVPDAPAVLAVGAIVPGWDTAVQAGPGLGAAIAAAVRRAADVGADRAVVVSGDNPDLPAGHLCAAIAALDDASAVLGPTDDGGYHLIGVRWRSAPVGGWPRRPVAARIHRRLSRALASVRMGGHDAAGATRQALERAGFSVAESPRWPDLDTVDDLDRLRTRLAGAPPSVAPATRRALADLESPPPDRS